MSLGVTCGGTPCNEQTNVQTNGQTSLLGSIVLDVPRFIETRKFVFQLVEEVETRCLFKEKNI